MLTWKSDEVIEVRTERLVHEQPPGLFAQHTDRFIVDDDDVDSDTVAESEMSSKIQIILAQSEWSSAEEAKPILKRWNKKQPQTFCDIGNVHVFCIASICIHGEELVRQLAFHQKYKRSHNETDVRHI